jgi:hypothetical protein
MFFHTEVFLDDQNTNNRSFTGFYNKKPRGGRFHTPGIKDILLLTPGNPFFNGRLLWQTARSFLTPARSA